MIKFMTALEKFLKDDMPDLAILKDATSNPIGRKLKLRSDKSFWLINRKEAESILWALYAANFSYEEGNRMRARIANAGR